MLISTTYSRIIEIDRVSFSINNYKNLFTLAYKNIGVNKITYKVGFNKSIPK